MLSHDLFEGSFARSGLVTNVEVFEEFPSHYEVALSRQHRWVRGDWQLLPWIVGMHGPLPPFARLKMVDNLRRSLSAPASLFTLLASFTLPGVAAGAVDGVHPPRSGHSRSAAPPGEDVPSSHDDTRGSQIEALGNGRPAGAGKDHAAGRLPRPSGPEDHRSHSRHPLASRFLTSRASHLGDRRGGGAKTRPRPSRVHPADGPFDGGRARRDRRGCPGQTGCPPGGHRVVCALGAGARDRPIGPAPPVRSNEPSRSHPGRPRPSGSSPARRGATSRPSSPSTRAGCRRTTSRRTSP